MQLIKLDAIASTNGYLKQLAQERDLQDFTVVKCDHQTQGRGQKGNIWVTDRGKNLTVSILKKFDSFDVGRSFGLNCSVSLAIYDVLNELLLPEVKVKWPNDIMSGNKKLCGILIENSLSGSQIKQSIIGIGLNVNQTYFKDQPKATSMKLESSKTYDLEELLEKIVNRLQLLMVGPFMNDFALLRQRYEAVMFRKDTKANYALADGTKFSGTIRGIEESGKLSIEKVDGQLVRFNFKEVKYLL